MIVEVEVVCRQPERPREGSPVRVEVRDTARADALAPLLAEARSEVGPGASPELATVAVDVPAASLARTSRPTVFVHVDVNGDGAISAGDYITTGSHPVAPADGEARVQATVERI